MARHLTPLSPGRHPAGACPCEQILSHLRSPLLPAMTISPLSCAGFEAVSEFGCIEIAANEHHARIAFLARSPFALQIAFENHMNCLEDEPARIVLYIDDALGAQDILPFGLGERCQ